MPGVVDCRLVANQPGRKPASMKSSPNGHPTILVVEDDWFVRDDLINVFEDNGWNVMAVASGEEALVLLDPPVGIDVVFTDIQLAGSTTGWEVGGAAKTAGNLPVIYTSGKVSADLGTDWSFFAKPYDAAAVVEACRIAILH